MSLGGSGRTLGLRRTAGLWLALLRLALLRLAELAAALAEAALAEAAVAVVVEATVTLAVGLRAKAAATLPGVTGAVRSSVAVPAVVPTDRAADRHAAEEQHDCSGHGAGDEHPAFA